MRPYNKMECHEICFDKNTWTRHFIAFIHLHRSFTALKWCFFSIGTIFSPSNDAPILHIHAFAYFLTRIIKKRSRFSSIPLKREECNFKPLISTTRSFHSKISLLTAAFHLNCECRRLWNSFDNVKRFSAPITTIYKLDAQICRIQQTSVKIPLSRSPFCWIRSYYPDSDWSWHFYHCWLPAL